MARIKPPWRQRLNARWLRWAAARATLGRSPALSRAFNFYNRALPASALAARVVEDEARHVAPGFTAAQRAFLAERCRAFDADWTDLDEAGGVEFRLATFGLSGVEVLGHTGAVADPRRGAMLWAAKGPPNWNYAKPRRLRSAGRIAGPAVMLASVAHYFHFVMNDLIPLADYLSRLHPPDAPLTLIVPLAAPSFAVTALQALTAGRPNLVLRWLGREEKLLVDDLVVIERRAPNREWFLWEGAAARRLKDMLTPHPPAPARPPGARLMVVRRGAATRRLAEEAALIEVARSRGFEVFAPRADNFAEQVQRFDAARQIVAVHGAALTNLAWARPGAQVLEIFPENFTKSTFPWLAERMGVAHHALIGGPGDYDQAFSLDPARFAEALDGMLGPDAESRSLDEP